MSKILEPIDHEEYWELPIGDKQVTRLIIDYGFTIEITHPDYTLTIRLIEDFLLSESGKESRLSIDNPLSLAPALRLLKGSVTCIKIGKTGPLEIIFSDESKISVRPSEDYEAWHVEGGSGLYGDQGLTGLRIICMPGGGLAVWTPESNPEKWALY